MRVLLAILIVATLHACGGTDEHVDVDARVAPPPVDAPPDPCASCTATQLCVQRFDGICTEQIQCVEPGATVCPPDTCTVDCEALLCPSPYQCQTRVPCGSEIAGAFTCYGP